MGKGGVCVYVRHIPTASWTVIGAQLQHTVGKRPLVGCQSFCRTAGSICIGSHPKPKKNGDFIVRARGVAFVCDNLRSSCVSLSFFFLACILEREKEGDSEGRGAANTTLVEYDRARADLPNSATPKPRTDHSSSSSSSNSLAGQILSLSLSLTHTHMCKAMHESHEHGIHSTAQRGARCVIGIPRSVLKPTLGYFMQRPSRWCVPDLSKKPPIPR